MRMSLVKRRHDLKIQKSRKGCWTCKARKIGCDKQLPLCSTCLRTGRSCEGYDIKVQWPETADGRRPTCQWEDAGRKTWDFVKFSSSGESYFLNTTYGDLQSRTSPLLSWYGSFSGDGSSPSVSKGLTVGFDTSEWAPEDETLLSYYHEVISRMITTIDDSQNGFRTVLIPRAILGRSLSSQALRESILALSALHLWGQAAAIVHKIRAIQLLSKSICLENDMANQFATCMMLCVCDVFDGSEGSWHNHLRAAKVLCTQAKATPTGGHTTYFLNTWLSYHHVLAEFSDSGEQWETQQISPQLPSQDTQNQVIIGSLGCSTQLLESISCINHLTNDLSHSPDHSLPPGLCTFPSLLQKSLESLQQIPGIVEDSRSGRLDSAKISNTAELFRLGALIYLHRSVLCTPFNAAPLRTLVSLSLDTLQKVGVCTSPWPLFMTALEVVGDEQRIRILRALDKMQTERKIANLDVIRGIIEAVWKKADLFPRQEGKTRVDWKEVVDMKKGIPSFI